MYMLSLYTNFGEDFQELIDNWSDYLENEEKEKHVSMIVDGQNYVMFFLYGEDVFGASEPNRVIFARMKEPDSETSLSWVADASFMASNITKTLAGQPSQQMFKLKDIPNIDIIEDRADVTKILLAQSEMAPHNPNAGMQNFIQIVKSRTA